MPGANRLSRKILISFAAVLLLASVAFLALFIETYRTRLAQERGNASEQVNRLLQVALENAMLKRDLAGLESIVARLGSQRDIAGVMILNPDFQVRFASDPRALQRRLSAAELGCGNCASKAPTDLKATSDLVTLADGRQVLRSVNPIPNREPCKECHGAAADHPINGILVVDHDATGIRREAIFAAAAMSGAGLLVVLLGLGSHWLALRRQVLSPIAALESANRALAAGDLSARVPVEPGRDDEVVDLSKSFNRMAGTLESNLAQMREQETFLKGLIDTVPDGVRVIDENKQVILVNASLARQAGRSAAELTGVPCYALHGRSDPCSPTLVTCPFHELSRDGDPIRYVHRHVRDDGSEVHVETTAARVTLDTAGRRRVLIIEAIRDLEQQIKYSHEQRLSEIGELAAGVAHEIYNPLASVRIGLQSVLRRLEETPQADPQATQFLTMVDGEVEKCIAVAKRLLDLSQVPSDSLQLVSLTTIVPEVVSLLRFEAEQRRVEVSVALDPELRVLATDPDLRMLSLNLIQNAFHAMPKGGKLEIRGRQDEKQVIVSFADTGVGIDGKMLAHIFDAFYSRRADGVHGTGLGLTISKAIVTRFGGTIEVESEVGVGSTFTLGIPRADSRLEDA